MGIPRPDVHAEFLAKSDTRSTWCEFKGAAQYLEAITHRRGFTAVGWSYADPSPGYHALRTGHEIFGLRTPCLRERPQEAIHEHRGFDRDQERGDDDQTPARTASDEGQSDLFHRADEPRGMVQVSAEKSGELRREAPRLLAGDAMDVAVGPARIVGKRWANCLTWLTNSGTTAKPSSKGPIDDQERDVLSKIALLQDVLRGTIRRCIEDGEFRDAFEQKRSIRERWPLSDPGS